MNLKTVRYWLTHEKMDRYKPKLVALAEKSGSSLSTVYTRMCLHVG